MTQFIKSDFYKRPVTYKKKINEPAAQLINQVKEALQKLSNRFHNDEDISRELRIIESLTLVSIQIEAEQSLDYFELNLHAQGVTKKISLISTENLELKLQTFLAANINNNKDFKKHYPSFRLTIDAIIKLPKNGDPITTLREASALNLSKSLELKTTDAQMVSYDNKPALLVLFSPITLLSHFTHGELQSTWNANFWSSTSNTNYLHYSIIKPIGEGIQPDCFIEDFANALPLLLLTGDPDTIGKESQNKAIIDKKYFFVYDQSVEDRDYFTLKSNLTLAPTGWYKNSRHGQGRNRTLIEDSAFMKKFYSLISLHDKLKGFFEHMDSEIKALDRNKNDEKLYRFKSILSDFSKEEESILTTVKKRIENINAVFPPSLNSTNLSIDYVGKILLLEKLINNPMLYKNNGYPYKNPWTKFNRSLWSSASNTSENQVESFEILDSRCLQILFKNPVNIEQLSFINRHLNQKNGDLIKLESQNKVIVTQAVLDKLTEDLLYPECRFQISPEYRYLNPEDLNQISLAYNQAHKKKILAVCRTYVENIARADADEKTKYGFMIGLLQKVKDFKDTLENKGFASHALKRSCFEIARQIQLMIHDSDLKKNLSDAFEAALKLDRIYIFTKIILTGLIHERINSHELNSFLSVCILALLKSNNYEQAKKNSQAIESSAQAFLKTFELNEEWIPVCK